MTGLDVILRYRKGFTYGHHTIVAALEVEPPSVPYALHLGRSAGEVASLVTDAVAAGRRALVAWSFYSPDAPAMAAELAAVRAAAPSGPDDGVLHVAGGVHATAEPLATLRDGFDVVAVGEGEATFTGLVEAWGSGADVASVPGTASLAADGSLARAAAAVRRPLDAYPPMPRTRNLSNPIEITRGCVYACKFCQTPFMFSARFRHRSVESVREGVATLRGRGLRDVRFITPTSLSYGTDGDEPDLDAVEALLAGCREEIGPGGRVFFGSFPSELRPEHVSVPALRMLARYVHNRDDIVGAQSGSDAVLARSGRGHGVAVVEEAVRLCVQEGFRPNVDVIFGMPGEDEEAALETVALMDRLRGLGARIHAHTFMPLPGTPWRDEAAGRIAPGARRALSVLTTSGAVYGSWERQEGISAEMAAVRSAEKGYRVVRRRPRQAP